MVTVIPAKPAPECLNPGLDPITPPLAMATWAPACAGATNLR